MATLQGEAGPVDLAGEPREQPAVLAVVEVGPLLGQTFAAAAVVGELQGRTSAVAVAVAVQLLEQTSAAAAAAVVAFVVVVVVVAVSSYK